MQIVIEVSGDQGAQAVLQALETYKARLRASIGRTHQRLREFEQCHNVTTEHFLANMTAEDLPEGDMEYVEWAGEARLLEGLEAELRELGNARQQLP